ncbi:unnamed protein product [Effrenium voratum]|nr:unnamed protein product [Effrenium voratum]
MKALLWAALWGTAAAVQQAQSEPVKTLAGFSVDGPQRVFRAQSGTVFLESGQQVEALARKEQRALQSQQVALEALAKQQSQANQRQQTLQAQFHLVEAKEQRMEELVKEQSKELLVAQEDKIKAELALEEQATGVQSARTRLALSGLAKTGTQLLQLAAASAADLSKEILRDQLIGAAVYFSLIMIAAFIYVTFFTYQYPMLKNQPVVYGDHFTFSLFECCNWDRDAPSAEIMRDRRIPCCSCCCLPVRWADTASSSKTGFLPFWPGVILIALLNAFTGMSFYVTSLLFTILATLHRQKIRKSPGKVMVGSQRGKHRALHLHRKTVEFGSLVASPAARNVSISPTTMDVRPALRQLQHLHGGFLHLDLVLLLRHHAGGHGDPIHRPRAEQEAVAADHGLLAARLRSHFLRSEAAKQRLLLRVSL